MPPEKNTAEMDCLKDLPRFKVENAKENLKVIQEPSEFYDEIKRGIKSAKTRICLASLYIGSSENELISMLENQVQANPSIQVDILVDYFRGSRIDANGKSTVSIISPLYQNYPNQCRLYLYHTPNVTELIKSIVPARFIEGFGLQHMKLYIFDDSLLISGANLSTDYFTNRQDRYILIRNHPSICDYFAGVIRIVSSFSYKNGSKVSAAVTCVSEIRNMLNDHLIRYKNTKIAEDNSSSSLVHESASTSSMTQDVSSTFIYPSLQMATFGIKQEEAIISRLLEYGGKNTHIDLAAGYFNLPGEFLQSILKASPDRHMSILTSSPAANGFFNSKGFSKFVPFAYNYLLLLFLRSLSKEKKSNYVTIHEYERPGWTWHGKGLWIYDSVTNVALSAIGSSNYNFRSFERDLEAQLYLSTTDAEVKRRLQDNLDCLYLFSKPISITQIMQRKTSFLLRVATRFLKRML